MLLKDFIIELRKEIDRSEWAGQLICVPPDTRELAIAEIVQPEDIIVTGNPDFNIGPVYVNHQIELQRWAFSHVCSASIEEWREIEPYLTPQITTYRVEPKQDPTYEEIFECLKGLKEVSGKALKTLSVEQLKRFVLGNIFRPGLINVSARYVIYGTTLYTHENCVKEAMYIAKRNNNANT